MSYRPLRWACSSVPETLAFRRPWRVIALVAVAALSYLVWRGYQQPDFVIGFANLRFC
jgi:hypothetical protein